MELCAIQFYLRAFQNFPLNSTNVFKISTYREGYTSVGLSINILNSKTLFSTDPVSDDWWNSEKIE